MTVHVGEYKQMRAMEENWRRSEDHLKWITEHPMAAAYFSIPERVKASDFYIERMNIGDLYGEDAQRAHEPRRPIEPGDLGLA